MAYPKLASDLERQQHRRAAGRRYYIAHRAECQAKQRAYQNKKRQSSAAYIARKIKRENDAALRLALKEKQQAEKKAWMAGAPERRRLARLAYKKTPKFLVKRAARRRLRKIIKEKRASLHFNKMIGCSPAALCHQLESKFLPGMSWANYGEWHIDHIKPCAMFDLSQDDQVIACFNHSNLQPLWAKDNIAKGAAFIQTPISPMRT